jgi:limonene-1,2-epoxide hydrolase
MGPAETVTAFIHAIETKDLDAALALVDDQIEYDNVPMAKVSGPEAVRTVLTPFLAGCTAVDWVVHQQVEQIDGPGTGTVMNERTDRFEMAGRWIELPVAGLFTVQDGKITLWRDYFDLAQFEKIKKIYNASRHGNPLSLPADHLQIDWITNDGIFVRDGTNDGALSFAELHVLVCAVAETAERISTFAPWTGEP